MAKRCKIKNCKNYVTGAGKKVTTDGATVQPVCDSCANKYLKDGAHVTEASESKPTTSADIAPGPGPEPVKKKKQK